MGVYERIYYLPEGFWKDDALGVCELFMYEDQDSPPQILGDLRRAPHVFDYADKTYTSLSPRGGI